MKEHSLSIINLPIQFDLDELETSLNVQIQNLLDITGQHQIKKDGMTIKVQKKGAIRLSFEKGAVKYSLPLYLWIEKEIAFTELKAEGEIELQFSTAYKISKGWQLSTQTNLIYHRWIDQPVLKLGLFDLPISFVADQVVDHGKEVIAQQIDQQIKSRFSLLAFAMKTWDKIQQPILIDPERRLWLLLNLMEVAWTGLANEPERSDENLVKTTLSFKAAMCLKVGDQPQVNTKVVLPPFHLIADQNVGFNAYLPIELDYPQAETLANQIVLGKTFEYEGRTVSVEKLELFGRGEKVVIKAELGGSFEGSVFLNGQPILTSDLKELEVKNLQFDLKPSSILFRGLAWIFKRSLEKQANKALRFPIAEQLDEVKRLAQEKLNHFEISPNLVLNGKIDKLNPVYIKTEENGIDISLQSKGYLQLAIKELDRLKLPQYQI